MPRRTAGEPSSRSRFSTAAASSRRVNGAVEQEDRICCEPRDRTERILGSVEVKNWTIPARCRGPRVRNHSHWRSASPVEQRVLRPDRSCPRPGSPSSCTTRSPLPGSEEPASRRRVCVRARTDVEAVDHGGGGERVAAEGAGRRRDLGCRAKDPRDHADRFGPSATPPTTNCSRCRVPSAGRFHRQLVAVSSKDRAITGETMSSRHAVMRGRRCVAQRYSTSSGIREVDRPVRSRLIPPSVHWHACRGRSPRPSPDRAEKGCRPTRTAPQACASPVASGRRRPSRLRRRHAPDGGFPALLARRNRRTLAAALGDLNVGGQR